MRRDSKVNSADAIDDVELAVRSSWEAALGRSDFRNDDDFFVIGGDSFVAARVVAELRTLDVQLRLSDFIENPTLAGMCGVIRSRVETGGRSDQ